MTLRRGRIRGLTNWLRKAQAFLWPDPLILSRLRRIEERLNQLEFYAQGGRSTYMGRGLVLVKTVVKGHQIAYLVEADDRLISPWFIATGQYELEVTDFFAEVLRPDDRCLDIGANFGYFTCLFSRFCPAGQVIGVEPDEPVFAIARDNLNINGLGGIGQMRHAAVREVAEPILLHRRVGRSGNTSIHKVNADLTEMLGEKPTEAFRAPGLTVDMLADELGRLDVMKVDVEGAEPLVFRGAAKAIATNPELQIVMEWSPGQIRGAGFDVGTFLDELAGMGLRSFGLGKGRPPLSKADLLAMPYAAGILLARTPR